MPHEHSLTREIEKKADGFYRFRFTTTNDIPGILDNPLERMVGSIIQHDLNTMVH